MTNKEKTIAPELTEAQKELREREERVSLKIKKALEEDGMALQPFMVYSEFGITARVRLVDTKNIDNVKQTNSEGDVKQGAESNGATESK